MKAITLHQPWASLVALGIKSIETRSWAPPKALIGERLLIHAGKGKAEWNDPVWEAMAATGLMHNSVTTFGPMLPGVIVASCVLADAVPVVAVGGDGIGPTDQSILVVGPDSLHLSMAIPPLDGVRSWRQIPVDDQRPYGDFAPGRWAWLLEDVKPTTERCPACWGEICGRPLGTGYGDVPCVLQPGHDGICNSFAFDDRLEPWCDQCRGLDGCPPIPAKGHQRVWEWTP